MEKLYESFYFAITNAIVIYYEKENSVTKQYFLYTGLVMIFFHGMKNTIIQLASIA